MSWNVSFIFLTVVSSALIVLLLESSIALTVETNVFAGKTPSKNVCLPQSELCCILRAAQSELRRQQSEISKRHFKTKRLPCNERRQFWNSYICVFINQYQNKIQNFPGFNL